MTNTAQGNENLMVLLSNITSHMSKSLERWHRGNEHLIFSEKIYHFDRIYEEKVVSFQLMLVVFFASLLWQVAIQIAGIKEFPHVFPCEIQDVLNSSKTCQFCQLLYIL